MAGTRLGKIRRRVRFAGRAQELGEQQDEGRKKTEKQKDSDVDREGHLSSAVPSQLQCSLSCRTFHMREKAAGGRQKKGSAARRGDAGATGL